MKKKNQKPFFAQFLESQKVEERQIKGGVWPPYDVTHKWPSDGDDDLPAS